MSEIRRPGGEIATRPLHFIWIADCSGSMAGDKINMLNFAIRDSIPEMRRVADDNPFTKVFVRAIKFSSGAQWHVAQAVEVKDFKWLDLQAGGVTDMGSAFRLVAEQLKVQNMNERGLPPVLVLLSDGQPTDDYKGGLKTLLEQPWGSKAVKLAIAIGPDADLDVLQSFINHPEIKPLQATNAPTLVNYIKWVSTAVLQATSSPASQSSDSKSVSNIPIPAPPDPVNDPSSVW